MAPPLLCSLREKGIGNREWGVGEDIGSIKRALLCVLSSPLPFPFPISHIPFSLYLMIRVTVNVDML